MKTHTSLLAAGALALALLAPGMAQAATGTTVLDEGFDDVNLLEGWGQLNNSYPQGLGWFQGNADLFPAQSGGARSYIATNYLGVENGAGFVDSWLFSPLLNLTGTTVLSFYSRTAGTAAYSDQVEVRFDTGLGTFDTLLTTVGGLETYPTSWTAFSTSVNVEGSGRFAFRYLGDADALDYVGIDSVKVLTAVPEPSAWLMLVLGLAGVGALRRKAP
jgi:hypothetical protein